MEGRKSEDAQDGSTVSIIVRESGQSLCACVCMCVHVRACVCARRAFMLVIVCVQKINVPDA